MRIDKCCFVNAQAFELDDLKELLFLEVLSYSFMNTKRLCMKHLPKLKYLRFDGSSKLACFANTEEVVVENVPQPYTLEIDGSCFKKEGVNRVMIAFS